MPYIITTTQALRDGEDVIVDALESVGTRVVIGGKPIVSRTAVATLNEAVDLLEQHGVMADTVDLSGGTVGPLPDGTIIEVRPMLRDDVTRTAGEDRYVAGMTADEMVVAFNAQQ